MWNLQQRIVNYILHIIYISKIYNQLMYYIYIYSIYVHIYISISIFSSQSAGWHILTSIPLALRVIV